VMRRTPLLREKEAPGVTREGREEQNGITEAENKVEKISHKKKKAGGLGGELTRGKPVHRPLGGPGSSGEIRSIQSWGDELGGKGERNTSCGDQGRHGKKRNARTTAPDCQVERKRGI